MRSWRGREWAVLATLSLGFFMTLLDLTIVNVAIPSMRRGLHASLPEIGWVINAYIIVLAVLMITAGRLGDLRGRRNLFIAGVAVFTVASATCRTGWPRSSATSARCASPSRCRWWRYWPAPCSAWPFSRQGDLRSRGRRRTRGQVPRTVRHPSRPQRNGTGSQPRTPARCDLDHIEKPPGAGNRFRYETVPYR